MLTAYGHPGEVLDVLAAAIYICDAEGMITYYNAAAEELWGRPPVLGKDRWCGAWKLYWPDGRPLPPAQCPMAISFEQRLALRDMEMMVERPDGTRVSVLSYPTPIFDQNGNLEGGVNTLLDISDRKQTETHEQHLALVVNSSDDAIISKNLDGIITSWNPGAERIFGYTAAEAMGKRITMLIPAERENEESEIISRIRQGIRIEHYETVRRRKDGRLIDVSLTVSPISKSNGEVIGASKIARDMTDRRRAERDALRLAAIIESSEDAILTKDLNGIITSWNIGAEKLFGYTAHEAIGRSVTILIPTEQQDEEPMILGRIREGERIKHYETNRQRKDGSLVDISLSVSPLRTAEGTIIGASKIARDITERRRARYQRELLLQEMNHRIKNLFSIASGVVRLNARATHTAQELSAAVCERLDALARAHALTLVKSPSFGATQPPATLHALLAAIISPYEGPGKEKGTRIAIAGADIALSPSAVTNLALLLYEFATNAAKYGALSTQDGKVAVHCFEEGDTFLITWEERGGPPVVHRQDAEGFGSVLSRTTVKGPLGGSMKYEWAPEGLTIRLVAARNRLTDTPPR